MRALHNTQLCSNRLVTEAGLARPRELPGCMSALLCLGIMGQSELVGPDGYVAGDFALLNRAIHLRIPRILNAHSTAT